ncbi:hypothetical protein [Rossellomorea marisflavi]|uniref:hypothetical protein n=1 Tax=Rossellomorea marisflavi TaxID=189381 RepID=UPI003458BE5B
MEGWSKFENEIVEMNVFHHQADMRIFIWLLTHVSFKTGLRVGEVELSSRQYVTSLKQLQKDLWFYDGRKKEVYSLSRIHRSIKRLEKVGILTTEAFAYGLIVTLLAPEHWGASLRNGREMDVKGMRNEGENIKKIVKKEKIVKRLMSTSKLQSVTDFFIQKRGKGLSVSPADSMALERLCEKESEEELMAFMEALFAEKGTINSAIYIEKVWESRKEKGDTVMAKFHELFEDVVPHHDA